MTVICSPISPVIFSPLREPTALCKGGGVRYDIYVDSVAGDDGNDGLTASTPLQTLAAAQTDALAFGNNVRIGLKYGSDWRDRLSLGSLTGVTIAAYGAKTDGLPVIRCTDILAGSWATSTDRADANTNVYSRSVSWTGDNSLWLSVWEDEARLAWASSLANCQSTPGSFFISGGGALVAASTGTLYVHPKASTNANSDGKVYEFGSRDVAIRVGNDSTVRRVWSRQSPGAAGGIVGGVRCLVEDCIGSGGVVHDILLASGIQRRCIGWIDYIDSRISPLSLEFYSVVATGLSGLWENCIVVSVGGGNSFGGHGSGGTMYDSWRLVGCSSQGAQIGGTDVVSVEIDRAKLVNSGVSLTTTGAGSCVITDPWYIRTAANEYTRIQPNGSNPMTIDGMRALNNSAADRLIGPTAAASPLTLRRSVFVDVANASARRYIFWMGNAQSADVDGVIFVSTGVNEITKEMRAIWNNGGTMDGQNNVFWPNTVYNCQVVIGGTTYATPSAYLTAVQPGNEVGSVVANPQLADPANGDFTASGSGLPAAGLERDPTCQLYTPIPDDLAAAEAWLLAA